MIHVVINTIKSVLVNNTPKKSIFLVIFTVYTTFLHHEIPITLYSSGKKQLKMIVDKVDSTPKKQRSINRSINRLHDCLACSTTSPQSVFTSYKYKIKGTRLFIFLPKK